MAIIVVGGSSKDVGKTGLVCAVISALRDFGWTAVKITGHDYLPRQSALGEESKSTHPLVWDETDAEEATDTSRYLAAGARRALLVTRRGPEIPIHAIRSAIADDHNILFESNRIIDVLAPDVCLALADGASLGWKPSFVRLLKRADALVTLNGSSVVAADLPADILQFHLQSTDQISQEMVAWLRSRIDIAHERLRTAESNPRQGRAPF